MKKQKYSNGSLVARKDFKGVGSIEGSLSGNQNQRAGEVKATINLGSGRLTASKSKNSMGDSATNYSVEKQLKNKSSVGANFGKNQSVNYAKKLGKGFELKAQVGKNYRGVSISKSL